MKPYSYHIPINEAEDGGSVTIYTLTIQGSRKQRRKEFGKYLKAAFGITNPRHIARCMGFKDLA